MTTLGSFAIGDVHRPRDGSGCIGRIVIDCVVQGTVFSHSAFSGQLFEDPAEWLAGHYERDASWCDGTLSTVVHPGMDGDGI